LALNLSPVYDIYPKQLAAIEEILMNRKIILTLIITVFILMFIVPLNVMALDDEPYMQCDDSIVAPGDSADSVIEKCGQPQRVLRPDPQEPVVWVYNFGSTEFDYYISIVNDQVQRIQSGQYGD
jgi:hypothetical protein